MPNPVQLSLPFACLDFPSRETVTVREVAEKLGVTTQHILDHIEAGTLVGIDTAITNGRSNMRIAVDEYRRFVLVRLTGPARRQFLRELPEALQHEIACEAISALTGTLLDDIFARMESRRPRAVRAPAA